MQLTFRILRELSTERTGFNSQVFFVTLPATFLSACCGSYNISATGLRVAWDHYNMIKRKPVKAFIFITFIISSNFKVNQNQGRKSKSKFKVTKKKYELSLRLLGKTQVKR